MMQHLVSCSIKCTATRGKCTRYLDIFSGASNLNSLQATELKFAECLDIFVQMYIARIKNDSEKDNVCTECMNMGTKLFYFLE